MKLFPQNFYGLKIKKILRLRTQKSLKKFFDKNKLDIQQKSENYKNLLC